MRTLHPKQAMAKNPCPCFPACRPFSVSGFVWGGVGGVLVGWDRRSRALVVTTAAGIYIFEEKK